MATNAADIVRTESTYPNAYNGVTDDRPGRSTSDWLRYVTDPSINIADELPAEQLATIGEKAVREYEIDKQSRADWEKQVDAAMKLAMQVTEKKHYPWPNAANIKYPLMTTAAIQFAARAYPAIAGQAENMVKGKVIGSDDGIPAQGPEGPVMDQNGEPVWEVEPGAKRKRADRIGRHMSWQLMEDMEEWEEDTDKLLSMLPIVGCAFRKTWFDPGLGRNRSELVTAKDCVVNYKTRKLELAPRITQVFTLYPYEVIEGQRMGLYRREVVLGPSQDSNTDEDAPHTFLEQHRTLDLDGDGYAEPYIVTVHEQTRQVLRIIARFDEEGILVNRRGEVARIEPVHYFTKYGFMPSLDGGFYDIGFGVLLNPINEAVNSTLNQMLDAGHLQNTGGGFLGGGLRIKGGNSRFRPGEYKQVDVTGGKVRDNVLPLPFPGPSLTLFNLLGLLIDAGKDITSTKDILTGEQGKVEPASTTLARIEQGLKVFTAIYKRIFRSAKSEFKKLYRLNGLYLDTETYFTVLDEPEAIGPEDYDTESVDVMPVADPGSVTDMQKLARAEFLMQFRGDPDFDTRAINERLLDAAGIGELDQLMAKEDPPPDPRVLEAADKMEIEKERVEIERADSEAKRMEIASKIILNLAKAEAEEIGPQMNEYKEQMAMLREYVKTASRTENGNQSGGIGGVAEQPVNPQGLPILDGPAGNPQGPMGLG